MNLLREQIKQLPKADVHSHLHLSGGIKLLKKKYPGVPFDIPNSYSGLQGMIDFIHQHVNRIMSTRDDVIHFMEMGLQSAIDDNVTYYEASVDMSLSKFFDHSVENLNSVVAELIQKYKPQIEFKPDLGINKDIERSKINSDGFECVTSGLYNGIDIYGNEHKQNLDDFVAVFELARAQKMKTKVHIGEFSNYKTIEEAIHLLKPDEIQHGIMAANSEKTMDLILENNIRLNICPQSNIALGSVTQLSEHPIRKLFDFGINVTINTDDFLLFNSSITDQYLDLIHHNIFTYEELDQIRKNGFS
jgi:adenosine deaminase